MRNAGWLDGTVGVLRGSPPVTAAGYPRPDRGAGRGRPAPSLTAVSVLVDLQRVTAGRPGRPLFTEVSIAVSDGDRLGVVGMNGSGKSTLLRILAGTGAPEQGTVRRARSTRVGYLEQRPELPPGTVREAVGQGWEAAAVLDRLGMADHGDASVATLSGGQAKRVALARVLLTDADLLVLDEPTNHLDVGAIVWLERRLATFRGALVVVSHDRHLLDRLTTRMLEIDRGTSALHEGGYASYLQARIEREARAVSAEATRRNLARRELAWLRRGAPARTRKPQARIDAALALIGARPDGPERSGPLELARFGTPRLGDKVIELHDVGFAHPDRAALFSHVELRLDQRARLGVVGANGTGKSTLLDVLAGRRGPSAGKVERGPTVHLGYYDQSGGDLDPAARVRDLVAGPTRPPGDPEDVRLMEQFWFAGETQWATVGTLSGGERRRLQLLLVLAGRPNVLLLDEPTNDLDLDTLRMLEDFLETWPGALVVASHDRAFLERTVVELLGIDGCGRAALVAGGVPAWVEAATAAGTASATNGADGPRRAPAPGPAQQGADRVGGRSPGTLRRLMAEAERDLTRLERRRAELEAAMGEAASDHVALARIGVELSELQGRVEQTEQRWITLAEEAEAR